MVRLFPVVVVLVCTAATHAGAGKSPPVSGWIWSRPDAFQDAPVETLYFRREFTLEQVPEKAEITIGADNSFRLFVNGVEAASGDDWRKPVRQDIRNALRPGRNVLAVIAGNAGGPAWLCIEGQIQDAGKPVSLATDATWRWSPQPRDDSWLRPGFQDAGFASNFRQAALLGDGKLAPHVRELFDKAEEIPPIPIPVDWEAFRARQRRDLQAIPRPADPPGDPSEHPVDRFLRQWRLQAGIKPAAQAGSSSDRERQDGIEAGNARENERGAQATGEAQTVSHQPSRQADQPARNISLPLCDDATFARRAYLDVTGLPPTEVQLKAFVDDTDPKKREKLVDALLNDDLAYAQGQMAWWCDLLRNDEQTNIDGLRKPITRWLFAALRENMPYDRMVAELLNPGPNGPDGYLKGVNWRGIVNASQRPPVQAAQNVGQVFLATSIKCASCHDHFTRPILLEDSYALASFFSATNLEIYRCDKPTGQIAEPEFLIRNTTLAKVDPNADLPTRLKAISEMVTSVRDPNFAPTMVNRLWKRLMGRGLFEPVDEISAKCAHQPLLDWLAYDFMAHDYDLRHTMRLLMTSRAYQLPAVVETSDQMRAGDKETPVFLGPPLRRLSSEQFADAVSHLTGYWPEFKTMDVQVEDTRIRAWRQKVPDALQLALGRPTREQVCTVRMEEPSMLQMLEMTNGKVLAERIGEGSSRLIEELGQLEPEQALTTLYLRGIAREPNADEIALLAPMLGQPGEDAETRRPGWEDVVWIICMSPEFQYIQ